MMKVMLRTRKISAWRKKNDSRSENRQYSGKQPGCGVAVLHREDWVQGSDRSAVWAGSTLDRVAHPWRRYQPCPVHASGAGKPDWRFSTAHLLVRRRLCHSQASPIQRRGINRRTEEGGVGNDGKIQGSGWQ